MVRRFSIINYETSSKRVEKGDDEYYYTYEYSVRVELPDESQEIIKFEYSENLHLIGGDILVATYDDYKIKYLYNEALGTAYQVAEDEDDTNYLGCIIVIIVLILIICYIFFE